MKGEPAFVVGLVDAGSVLHQEGHHVHVVIYACLKGGEREREMECQNSVLTCPVTHIHMSSRQRDSRCYRYRKSPATQLTGCHVVSELLGILAAGVIPNHLCIAGALQIPHYTALLMEGVGALPIGRYLCEKCC